MSVGEIVFDFIEEWKMSMMKADNDIDVEEDMPFAGSSRKYISMKPWRLCLSSRTMEKYFNKIHKRPLRLVYDDFRNLPFKELLVKASSVSLHQKIFKL